MKRIIKNFYYNNLNSAVKRINNGKLKAYCDSYFYFEKDSNLILKGVLETNANCKIKNGRSTIIRLDEKSKMIVNGKFSVFYGGDIICFKNSNLELGSGFFNSNIKIRCTKSIKIGKNVFISHDVTIMDSDAHYIDYAGYEETKPVTIGDNVWIGTRVTILKGVNIGDGAVIGAGSVVTRDIPANCIAVGSPAKVIKENIKWRGKR